MSQPQPAFDCREYLGTVLPALLQRSTKKVDRDAVIQWVVRDRPDCSFAYQIDSDGVKAQQGHPDKVDLTIAIYSSDLMDLSRNALDAKRALQSTRLQLMGDASLLLWISQRLSA